MPWPFLLVVTPGPVILVGLRLGTWLWRARRRDPRPGTYGQEWGSS